MLLYARRLILLLFLPSIGLASGIYNPGTGGGGGGGSSTLQISSSGVQITSPTASINFNGQQFSLGAIGSTATIAVNGTSVTLQGNTFTNTAIVYGSPSNGLRIDPHGFFLWDDSNRDLSIGSGLNTNFTNTLQLNGNSGGYAMLGVKGGSVPLATGLPIGNPYAALSSGTSFFFLQDVNKTVGFVSDGGNLQMNSVNTSSETVGGQLFSGTLQGSGLSTCGDGTHALNWSGGTFGCQALSGGSAGTPNTSIQFDNNGSFGGAANTSVTSSSITISEQVFITSLAEGTSNFGTLSSSNTISPDASKANTFIMTLTSTMTVNGPSNGIDGQKVTFRVIQDAAGGRTLTLATGAGNFSFGTDLTNITLSAASNAVDYFGAIFNSTQNRWNVVSETRGF